MAQIDYNPHDIIMVSFPRHANDLPGAVNELMCCDYSFSYEADKSEIHISSMDTKVKIIALSKVLEPFAPEYNYLDLPF